jgi:N-acetylmuramoyl-L-alanine amidase
MQIRNNRLVDGWYEASPNHGGALHDPTLLVMHFTASGGTGPQDDADYFLQPASKVSAHVVLGRDGAPLQVVPFDAVAWHAGVSIWRGRPNCNDFSIGIEVDNWGKLVQAGDGQIRSPGGQLIEASQAVWLTHKHETAPAWWETYNPRQLTALDELTRAVLAAYPSITEVVGHDDIAPGRKIDPGPAFPMARYAALVSGRGNSPVVRRTVIASRLNARGGPGLQYEVQGAFTEGADLQVLYDSPAGWAQVVGVLSDGSTATAWVSDQYLR